MPNTNVSTLIALLAALSTGLAKASVADESSPPPLLPCSRAIAAPQQAWSSPPPAAKRLANLDAGPPRTVRLIYFLPNDRPYQSTVVHQMKKMARRVETFYAEQMQAHGYGDRAFRLETDATGGPKVHRVEGQHRDSYYRDYTFSTVQKELMQKFDLWENIYIVVIDNSRYNIGFWGGAVGGVGTRNSKDGGLALFHEKAGFRIMAHELGHAFGLAHDFRDDAYIMSYGRDRDELSACAAGFLAVHPHFHDAVSIFTNWKQRPTIDLISSPWYPAGASSVSVQLSVRAPQGLHQVTLFARTKALHGGAGDMGVKACRGLGGEQEAVVEFDYDGEVPSAPLTTSLSESIVHGIDVGVVDRDGDELFEWFVLAEISPYHIGTLEGQDRGSGVFSVAFAPDGKTLAAGGGRTVELWDVDTKTKIASFEVGTINDILSSVAFAPDGKTLAVGVQNGEVTLWDVDTKTKIANLEHGNYRHISVAFAPDGKTLATGIENGEVTLWDVDTKTKIATLEEPTLEDHVSSAAFAPTVAFAPDGKTLAAGAISRRDNSYAATVTLWDVDTKTKIANFGPPASVYSVAFSPDGKTLAAGRRNRVHLWNMDTKRPNGTFLTPWKVHSVAFSPDGAILAAEVGSTIQLWDMTKKTKITTFAGAAGRSVAFAPEGSTLAAGGRNGSVELWDVSEWVRSRTHHVVKTTGEDQQASGPHRLTKDSGEGQESPASTQLNEPLVVSVLDQHGSPFAGAAITFSVTTGAGMLSAITDTNPCTITASTASTTTTADANGQAATRLTLGSQPGTNTVAATVEGLEPVTFTATAAAPATPHRLTTICGQRQEGTAGAPLAKPLVVSVSDEEGAAIAGVVVSFAVTAGGGTLSAATAPTDANGQAATRLTLGSEPGANTVAATVEGIEPVTFSATGEVSMTNLLSGKRGALPTHPQLAQNAPNPFNSQTILSYFLPAPTPARLAVFTLTGQRVAVLHQGPQQAGYHRLHWDGRDAAGRLLASGVYLYRLVTDEAVLTRKLILLR